MALSPQDHYARDGIVEQILAALDRAGTDTGTLAAERLYPHDQLHGREIVATRDHAALLAPGPDDHVLDIGAGIGGPARYLAATYGCRVTGLDLTPDFVAAADRLSRLCGLADRNRFVLGDAADMPYETASFDQALCLYVGMNLPDKPAVLDEAARVLRPGGRMVWSQVVSRDSAPPHFPLPWAREPGGSFLTSSTGLCDMIGSAGFTLISVSDETAAHVELARQRAAAGPPPEADRQVNALVMGADFAARRANYIRSLAEGRIASLVILARRD
jgi:precorrin-6B methylase 2